MIIAISILIILVILLTLYIFILQKQLCSINRQLDKRLEDNTKQPITLELINSELNKLTININKCLKAEAVLRLNNVREEKNFKEMIANISHDLRTPLTAIKGYQQLMANDELTLEQQKRLQVAQKHAEELGNLIEHLFEYSYLINAEPKLKIEKVNITNLVTECLATAVPDFEKHGIRVRIDEAAAVYGMVDQEMTLRIIQNLIRNCVSHSASDVEVQIIAAESLENVLIVFKNLVENPEEIDVKCLFERFYTRDKARSKTTGLGLSIVKLLAEQMGGTVGAGLKENELAIQVELPLCK